MLDKLKSLFDQIAGGPDNPETSETLDPKLCAAVLMVHAIAIDGQVTAEEEAKLLSVLRDHYAMDANEARTLAEEARKRQEAAVDVFAFTSVLRQRMSEEERMLLVEDLWEMVYADGELHEYEDNLLWRLSELLNVPSDHRLRLKRLVRDRESEG